jgi:hypothetical protein
LDGGIEQGRLESQRGRADECVQRGPHSAGR